MFFLLLLPSSPLGVRGWSHISNRAVGAELAQKSKNGDWRPLAFFSRALNKAEQKYSAFDRELLAIYLSIKHFRHFLEGGSFTVFTDHKQLTFALGSSTDRSPDKRGTFRLLLSLRRTFSMSRAL